MWRNRPDWHTYPRFLEAKLPAVRGTKAVALAQPPAPEAGIALAPGGGLYAWLLPNGKPEALYSAQRRNMETIRS